MQKTTISLRISNMKELKMGYGHPNFYLVYHTLSNESLISQCRNVLFDEAPFEVENIEEVHKI